MKFEDLDPRNQTPEARAVWIEAGRMQAELHKKFLEFMEEYPELREAYTKVLNEKNSTKS